MLFWNSIKQYMFYLSGFIFIIGIQYISTVKIENDYGEYLSDIIVWDFGITNDEA